MVPDGSSAVTKVGVCIVQCHFRMERYVVNFWENVVAAHSNERGGEHSPKQSQATEHGLL